MEEQPRDLRVCRRPASPCVNICTLDEADVCTGCLRTLEEIADWGALNAEAQWRIVDELPERAASHERKAGAGGGR